MKELSATATGVTTAEIEHCYAHLLDVERYPSWYPDGVRGVEVLERGADDVPTTVDAVLVAVAGPLRKEFQVRLAVEREQPTRIALARVADERGDHELLTIAWQLRELGEAETEAGTEAGTEVVIELGARLDVPMFLPIDPVAREVADGFLQAALRSL